jgi:hypothetical protein
MTTDQRLQQIRDEITDRARAYEPNTQEPDQPTLAGWLVTMLQQITELRARVDELEREAASR